METKDAIMKTNTPPQPAAIPAAPDSTPSPSEALKLFPKAPGESDRAFEAFRAYLELGPRRRYVAVGRKVGASLRTVKRWAVDFDWRGRIKTHAARCAEHYTETEATVQREELLDATARAKAFRDCQYDLADFHPRRRRTLSRTRGRGRLGPDEFC